MELRIGPLLLLRRRITPKRALEEIAPARESRAALLISTKRHLFVSVLPYA